MTVAERAARSPHSPIRSGDTVRVLVVDDSPDHRALMRRRLEASGLHVLTAEDASEAVVALDVVDLVVLDYRLGGDSGLDLLREIRELESPPSVIMVTGLGSTDLAVEAMRAGAVDYVAKESGYLERLPDVVWRAWQTHDQARRADQLQRLALLVSSATDREGLFDEVLSGAKRLLRARSCVLLLVEEGRLVARSMLGPEPPELAGVLALDGETLDGWTEPRQTAGLLLVPLPRDGGPPVGLLVAWTGEHESSHAEVELARAFASFAGIALHNLRRRELEQRLVGELQRTVDARQDFVASISHELRTPLTSISGFAETLRDHWGEVSDEQRTDLLDRVRRNAEELRVLVDELIDIAALERGGLFAVAPTELDVAEVVGRVVGDAAGTLREREVVVELGDARVVADEALVRRTLQNLLTNAVKFSQPGSRVVVRTIVREDHARVEVVDRGVGLRPSEAARVFDPFYRSGSSVVNAVRGSGIGLALVKQYVRTMGGTAGVESVPGQGSTFWFTLPLVGAAPAPQQPTSPGVLGVVDSSRG